MHQSKLLAERSKVNVFLLFLHTALESKLVSQFCEDEHGTLIYDRTVNGRWNGNNGHGLVINEDNGHGLVINGNNGHGQNTNGYNGQGNNGYGKNGNNDGYIYQEEIQNQRRTNSRGRGDTFTLPISADPLPVQVC